MTTIDRNALRADTATVDAAAKREEFDSRANEIRDELNQDLPTWKRDALHAELRNHYRLAGHSDEPIFIGIKGRSSSGRP